MDNIQLTLESSTTSLSLNSDSIYLNPEIDGLAGLPEIRTTSGVNAGYNGGWTSAQFYDARLITIRGVISDSDISVVEDRRKALVGLLGQGRKEELTLHFVTAGGNSYVLNCRTISCEMALSGLARKQEFLIQLRADDPLIYDDGALATEAIVNVRRALGGFQIDFGLPLYIGGGVNETLVENGNETVYPVINLYGPLHSPTIINQTTNQQMQVLTDLDYTLTWVNPVEVTGDYILVTNETDKDSPLSSVELLGNTTQDTLSGKNLADTTPKSGGSNGVVAAYNNSTGEITLSGTPNKTWSNPFANTFTLTAGTYTLKQYGTLTNGLLAATSSSMGGKIVDSTTKEITFTITEDSPDTYIWISNLTSGTATSGTIKAQLEKSSSASDFEPFCGGMPAPNPTYPIAVQTTTGEQVVKMRGKNLLNYTTIQQTTKNGVSCSLDSDGTITLNGTCSANNTAFVFDNTNIYLDGTYTLSFWVLGGSVSNTTNDTAIRIYQAGYTQGLTVRLTNGPTGRNSGARSGVYVIGNIRVDSGVVFNNYQIRIQLEKSSERTDFEPYQSQSYEVNLTSINKNIFTSPIEVGTISSGNGADSASTNRVRSIEYMLVEPNTTYTLSATAGSDLSAMAFFYTDAYSYTGRPSTSWIDLPFTFTTASDTRFVRLVIKFKSDATITISDVSNIQLESSLSATSFIEAQPIELCKLGTYQDKIYKSGDDWFVHREVGKAKFADMNFNYGQIGSTEHYRQWSHAVENLIVRPPNNETLGNALSSAYTTTTATNTYNRTTGVAVHYSGQIVVYDANYDEASSVAFNEKMAEIDAALYYALATPTDTQITNQALIDQLEALASSTLFVGVNNIALVPSGGAQGELSIDYFSAYTEDRDIVVIDSQARTITKNGADIYYLKADGSEFPTLAPGENTLYLTSEQTSDEGYAEIKFKQGYLSI